jgi:hypothetical protein
VQADGRFVQHVEHAAEIRAELRGEADALRFAPGKRRHGATELHVAEPDFVEELQALADFGNDVAGNLGGAPGELQLAREIERRFHVERGEGVNGRSAGSAACFGAVRAELELRVPSSAHRAS